MNRQVVFIMVYVVLTVLSMITLYYLGESRVDAYISLNILSYYIAYAVIRPHGTDKRVTMLNVVLIALFAVIIAYRLYEVITG